MSMVIKDVELNKIILFSKGADSYIMENLKVKNDKD